MEAWGQTFDSKAEYKRWNELLLLHRAGEITGLKRQVPFVITAHNNKGEPVILCKYVADAVYIKDGQQVVEDVKSPVSKTAVYRLKKKLLKLLHGIEIVEIT